MLERLRAYIEEKKLIPAVKSHLLLAVSGGIDSMAMLHLFQQLPHPLAVAHFNFKLRGNASDNDEVFVADYCKKNNIPFHSDFRYTKDYANETGISVQMAARDLRYRFFQETLEKENYQLVATAHHLNDSIETALLNIVKGTGISGITGVPAKRGNIIRPLLFATKEEIREYAGKYDVPYRTDASNLNILYERNFIRHEVLPKLKELNPNLEETLRQNLENWQFAQTLYRRGVQRLRYKLVHNVDGISEIRIKQLLGQSHPLNVLYELLKAYGFNRTQCEIILKGISKQSGRTYLSSSHRLIRDRNKLFILSQAGSKDEFVFIEENTNDIKTNYFSIKIDKEVIESNEAISKSPNRVALDKSKLEFPLLLRKWQQGDYFYPFGLRKKKKVSRFLIDQKVPIHEKEHIYVLCSGQKIVWVVGYRIDDRFKIIRFPEDAYILSVL